MVWQTNLLYASFLLKKRHCLGLFLDAEGFRFDPSELFVTAGKDLSVFETWESY